MTGIVVDLRPLESEDDLAFVLGTSGSLVRAYLKEKEKYLAHHRLPKRGGRGFRDVLQVRAIELADCFKALADHFHGFFADVLDGYPHDAAHGYALRRSIKTNAAAHLGASRVLRADIKKFFPTIKKARVESFFLSLGCKADGARVLAEFLTYKDTLPLGLSTSPVLANAICFDLDRDLQMLAGDGKYTRYADDLTFSGGDLPSKFQLTSVLSKHGFTLNDSKYRVQHRGRGVYVTGLSVEDAAQPRVPKAFKRGLRQELRFARRFGLEDHCGMVGYSSVQSGVNKITGRIHYLRGIERALGDRLLAEWNRILEEEDAKPTFLSRGETAPRDVMLFIDESEPPAAFPILAMGCVATEDFQSIGRKLEAFLKRLKIDPYMSGRKKVLETKGLHWADLPEEARTEFVRLLAELPVRVFISFVRVPKKMAKADYVALYLKLVRFLVRPRFSRYDRARATVVAEENSKVSSQKFADEINGIQSVLAAGGARRPVTLAVRVAGKLEEPCLALADAFLGVFADYAATPTDHPLEGMRWRRFERLRSKYRLIYNADTHDAFSRRNLFFKSNLETPSAEGETST